MSEEIRVLDDELVADYLRRHPEFFLTQDELLADLRIPHSRGSSVSLVERQLAVLRERSLDMHQRLNQLLEVARNNDRLFDSTRQLTLKLLEADSLATLVAALEDGLRERFQVVILSDTFYEFSQPLMRQLGFPTLLCHKLVVDENDRVVDYQLRQKDPKRQSVLAFKSLYYRVIAAGDSYNDTTMLGQAEDDWWKRLTGRA